MDLETDEVTVQEAERSGAALAGERILRALDVMLLVAERSGDVFEPITDAAALAARRMSQALSSLEKQEAEDAGWEVLPSVSKATRTSARAE